MVVGYTSTLNQKTLDEALKDIDGDTTALLIAISTKPDASSSPQVEQSNNQNKSYTLDQWDEITQEHEVVGGAAIITCTNSSGGYGYVWSSIPMRAPNRYALLAGTDTVPGKNLQNLGSCTGDAENMETIKKNMLNQVT